MVFKYLFRQSWWVGVFSLSLLLLYNQVAARKNREIICLEKRLGELEGKSREATQEREELSLKLSSEGDPAWIEMVLMKNLGMVPEGCMKVHFLDTEKASSKSGS